MYSHSTTSAAGLRILAHYFNIAANSSLVLEGDNDVQYVEPETGVQIWITDPVVEDGRDDGAELFSFTWSVDTREDVTIDGGTYNRIRDDDEMLEVDRAHMQDCIAAARTNPARGETADALERVREARIQLQTRKALLDTFADHPHLLAPHMLAVLLPPVVKTERWGEMWSQAPGLTSFVFRLTSAVHITVKNPRANLTDGQIEYSGEVNVGNIDTGALVLHAHRFLDVVAGTSEAHELGWLIADAIAAAEAGVVPGLEALYVAKAKRDRIAEAQREIDARSEDERVEKIRQALRGALESLGVDTSIGHFTVADAGWHYDDAAVYLSLSGNDLYVYPDDGEDGTNSIGIVHSFKTNVNDAKADLLFFLDLAHKQVETAFKRRVAAEANAKMPPKPVYIGDKFAGDNPLPAMLAYLNEQRAEGYALVSLTPEFKPSAFSGFPEPASYTIVMHLVGEG